MQHQETSMLKELPKRLESLVFTTLLGTPQETPHWCFLKTVPVNFVVNTIVIQYCVYYEIYWNSLYEKK